MQCEDPFAFIDDLLDFQNEDDWLAMMDGCDNGDQIAPLQTPEIAGRVHDSPTAVAGSRISSEEDALRSMLQRDDIEIINLDWLSNFIEESDLNFLNPIAFISQSPTPILENNKASTSSTPDPPTSRTRTQTKGPRAQVTRPISPSSLTLWVSKPEIMEKTQKSNVVDRDRLKKCLHCESHKTPQWRAGPMGPKTLCNACGVRYMSGRLFPEYRPATSPKFTPFVHSNSHKKVVEMRQEKANLSSPNGDVAKCELLDYIRNK
ncbi:GATA transcription factor 4-like [Phalaenopsis equestris]|uniref:GATA transcription factor 4-like n=1 Tax=Phalaenopsis equestris TaxID=78828 RepID=UPI0009E4A15B|nr:GATA transcription factor 4-like [Phalaenopsis equestris]